MASLPEGSDILTAVIVTLFLAGKSTQRFFW